MTQVPASLVPRKPEYMKVKLRKRSEIASYLLGGYKSGLARFCRRGGMNYDGQSWLFCWNVKLYDLDLSFQMMMNTVDDSGGLYDDIENARHQLQHELKARWDELNGSTRSGDAHYIGIEAARDGITIGDRYTHDWAGNYLGVQYSFYGRSGGWLVMTKFQDQSMTATADVEELIEDPHCGYSFNRVRELCAMVQTIDHELTTRNIQEEVTIHASRYFFENQCEDIFANAMEARKPDPKSKFLSTPTGFVAPRRRNVIRRISV